MKELRMVLSDRPVQSFAQVIAHEQGSVRSAPICGSTAFVGWRKTPALESQVLLSVQEHLEQLGIQMSGDNRSMMMTYFTWKSIWATGTSTLDEVPSLSRSGWEGPVAPSGCCHCGRPSAPESTEL